MRVIIPRELTLLSSNVPDDTAPVWNETTTYNTGDQVLVENLQPNNITKKFESVVDSNTGNYPPDNPDKWRDLGAIDKYKILDQFVGTQSEAENLTFTVRTSKVDTLALINIAAADVTITVRRSDDSTIIYGPETFNLRYSETDGWYSYFFSDISYRTSLLVDIPITLGDVDIEVAFTGSPAKCGLVYAGRAYYLGESLFGARVGIKDFSVKEFDEFGWAYLVKRDYSKQLEIDVRLSTPRVSVVQQVLANLRATPCVWDANNSDTSHEALIVYGFYESFEEVMENAGYSFCSLRIEGLI